MSSIVITIKSPRSLATMQDALRLSTTQPVQEAAVLANYFYGIASGAQSASFDVNTASADPVAASGTLTLTYASIAANDTFTVGKTTLTWKTTAPANENEVRKITDLATTAENLVTAINAHSVLGGLVTATRDAGVVTVTCKVKGEIGNQIGLTTSNSGGTAVSAAYLAGGTGGGTGTPVRYALGL